MRRPHLPGLLLACLPTLLAAQQTPPRTEAEPAAVLLLRDANGTAVADAIGTFRLARDAELPALQGVALPGTQLATRELHLRGDARGTLRLPADETMSASGLVSTPRGLGALVARLRPREARRLTLTPMGEVTTHGGSEPFTLWVRATLPTGDRITLPPVTATAVRLPAGSYEAWARGRDGVTWQRLDVRSGQRTLLVFPAPAQRVQLRPGTLLHPAGWPELDLGAGGGDVVLTATALPAPLVAFHDGRSSGERVLPGPVSGEPLPWPPAPDDGDALVIPVPPALGGDQATVLSLRQDAARGFVVLAAARARDGRCTLPPPPPGDTWLLVLARDRAPRAQPWSALRAPEPFATAPGQPLVVRVRDERGDRAADVALRYEPDGMAPAAVLAHSDGRGEARFGPVLGPGRLRVVDERFANQTVDLAAIPGPGIELTVAAGHTLRGVAQWDDGRPASGVVVTVRDPSGRLQPSLRAQLSDERGGFAFGGLREDRTVVLFATAQRNGRTWSGKLDRLFAGGEDVVLILRDEDPVLTPPGK